MTSVTFVLDASMAMAFVFEDEATHETDQILDRCGEGHRAVVPALWRWEVGNALLMAARRERLSRPEARQHLARLGLLPVTVDERAWHESWGAAWFLAAKHRLTLYDAAYLELAVRLGAPLASLDTELRRAAKAEGVTLWPGKL